MSKKRSLLIMVAMGIVVGWFTLGGAAYVMKYTSSTEFCLSCHTMQIPYEEYQGSVHYSNQKGIRAECADCHIPSEPIDFLVTKIKATKDVYHEFVTGKIDSEEKYEEHRMAMAENVWKQMRANDSATCRSCHSFDAMDTFEQSEQSVKMHEYGIENNQTCIDCHKGVAHFPPEVEMDSEAFDRLIEKSKTTDNSTKTVFPITIIATETGGKIYPATPLTVLEAKNSQRKVQINGFQMKGAEQVIYLGKGQRGIIALLSELDQKAVNTSNYEEDEYGNSWRSASLITTITDPVLGDVSELWTYAGELDNVYCSGCHALIPAKHFTVNAWKPVAKGMGDRTDISDLDLEILTKYFQYHAKDVINTEH